MLGSTSRSVTVALFAQLLDLLPIGVALFEATPELTFAYHNKAYAAWVPRNRQPCIGLPFKQVFDQSEGWHVMLDNVRIAGEPISVRGFPAVGISEVPVSIPGDITMWDLDIHPVGSADSVSHVLLVAMDVTARSPMTHEVSKEEAPPEDPGPLHIVDRGTGPDKLTGREREVVRLVAQGLTNPAIGEQLFLSRATVAHHVANILAKLGFASRAQIAAWAVENKLFVEAANP